MTETTNETYIELCGIRARIPGDDTFFRVHKGKPHFYQHYRGNGEFCPIKELWQCDLEICAALARCWFLNQAQTYQVIRNQATENLMVPDTNRVECLSIIGEMYWREVETAIDSQAWKEIGKLIVTGAGSHEIRKAERNTWTNPS